MDSNDAFSGTSSSDKSYLRPVLQDIILLDLWFPAASFLYGAGKCWMPTAYSLLPPLYWEREEMLAKTHFAVCDPIKRATDQRYDSFWVFVQTKARFLNWNAVLPGLFWAPLWEGQRSAGRNFSPHESIHHAHADMENSSFSIGFDFLSCFLLFLTLKTILTQSTVEHFYNL